MKKEEKIVVVLLVMVLLSLSIAYVTFFSDEGSAGRVKFSSSSLPGDEVYLEGSILTKRFTYTGDHLLMDVDYGGGIVMVFVPSDNGAGDVYSKLNENDYVSLTGTVQEYNGEMEVLVHSSNDISIL